MKNLNTVFICIFLLTGIYTSAQDCDSYLIFKEGTALEMSSYDKKGKDLGRTEMSIISVDNASGHKVSKMHMNSYDEAGALIVENAEFEYSCEGNILRFDMSSYLNKLMPTKGDMEISVEGELVEYSTKMSVGDELKSAPYAITTKVGEFSMNMDAEFINRKVIAKESISTPAGNFDCFHISYEVAMNMSGIKSTSKTEEWYSPEIGFVIKSNTYNKRGKLISTTVLSKLEKN